MFHERESHLNRLQNVCEYSMASLLNSFIELLNPTFCKLQKRAQVSHSILLFEREEINIKSCLIVFVHFELSVKCLQRLHKMDG